MRVIERDAKAMLCPMKLANSSLADKFCEGLKCMAFKEIGSEPGLTNNAKGGYDSVEIPTYLCGLARVL